MKITLKSNEVRTFLNENATKNIFKISLLDKMDRMNRKIRWIER